MRKKERTRRQLAEVGLVELFSERGYAGTTIDDIVAAVDVSPRAPLSLLPDEGGPRSSPSERQGWTFSSSAT